MSVSYMIPIIFANVFLHISSGWVKIRLHTENQLPRLPGSALKVPGGAAASYMVAPQPLIWFLPIIKSSTNSC